MLRALVAVLVLVSNGEGGRAAERGAQLELKLGKNENKDNILIFEIVFFVQRIRSNH